MPKFSEAFSTTGKVFLAVAIGASFFGFGCGSPSSTKIETSKNTLQERKPDAGAWSIEDPKVNPIDGTKTQFLSTGPIGSQLVLCFENGRMCSGKSVGVFVKSPCWVEGGEDLGAHYERQVRLRFDTDKFLVETWGISDDHYGIFPHSPKNFVASLKKHKSLLVEFGCARYDSDVVSFDVQGLDAALKSAGLVQPQESEHAREADAGSERSETRSGGVYTGGQAAPGDSGGPGMNDVVRILSDTQGVDFTNYINRLLTALNRNWAAVMPESARLGDKGIVFTVIQINPDGSTSDSDPQLDETSGKEPLDNAVMSAVHASNPFEPLPSQFQGPFLKLRIAFIYNIPREEAGLP